MPKTPPDINQIPKIYCDNFVMNSTAEVFQIALFAGGSVNAYALSPEHMKKVSQLIAAKVAEFETNIRPIHAEWSENIPSPVQAIDLQKNPPEEKEE
jgi:hypothetical protein